MLLIIVLLENPSFSVLADTNLHLQCLGFSQCHVPNKVSRSLEEKQPHDSTEPKPYFTLGIK